MIIRLFPTLLAIAGLLMATAQPPAPTPNATDTQGRKQGAWSKTWAPGGPLRYSGQFKDDKPYGLFKHYDEEGHLTTEQRYSADGALSRATHFHPGGQVMARGKYVGQVKDSTWNYYTIEGKLKSVERYSMGQLNGERMVYYDEGGVAETAEYVNGKQHGPWKQFFPNGMVKAQAIYANGEPEGMMTWSYPTGKKEIEGNTINGQRDGIWTYYLEDGSIQIQMVYRMGEFVREKKFNGVFKDYYEDDQLKAEINYKDGFKNGPFSEYYDNGKWVIESTPADPALGIPSEPQRVLKGQTKKREGTYVKDALHGTVKIYDESGKLMKEESYDNGTLTSTKP